MIINIVDVICLINNNNMPVGHEEKAINQATMLFDGNREYTIGKFYKNHVSDENIKCNPVDVKATDSVLLKYAKCIINSYYSIRRNTADVIWFINMNEVVFWVILLLPKKAKYMMTTYVDWNQKFAKKCPYRNIRKMILEKALRKVDLVIATNYHYHLNVNYIHIPDFYLDEQYKRYIYQHKDGVVCVGVMSESQGILEIARAFRNSSLKIIISGYFRDEEYFNKVKQNECDNVVIQNIVLPYEKYIKMIGMAKYIVIPYRNSHANRTSGVLQETVALNSIPVSFPDFLRYNNVQGITFEKYEDIPIRIKEYESGEQTIHNDWKEYDYQIIKDKLSYKISELANKKKKSGR